MDVCVKFVCLCVCGVGVCVNPKKLSIYLLNE